jgi:hypothetical protein
MGPCTKAWHPGHRASPKKATSTDDDDEAEAARSGRSLAIESIADESSPRFVCTHGTITINIITAKEPLL